MKFADQTETMNPLSQKPATQTNAQKSDARVCLKLVDVGDTASLFTKFSRLKNCLFLDSASRQPIVRSRYSFLMAEPVATFEVAVGEQDIFPRLRDFANRFETEIDSELPPFQGGVAGFFSYDIARSLESLPEPTFDDFQMPAAFFGLYDVVAAIDNVDQSVFVISQGWNAAGKKSADRARQRLDEFVRIIETDCSQYETKVPARKELSVPTFATDKLEGLRSNFSKPDFLKAVQKTIDYIFAGDIFQANLAQQLFFPADRDAASLYKELRIANPAPFSCYFDLGPHQIVSASPERLVQVQNGIVETRPIKGTRPRTRHPEVDIQTGQQLKASEKDRAENTMIVDLMRNDLSRVCTDDSVVVTQLCELEEFQSVLHLVSAVQGKLSPKHDSFDLLAAVLPGGSITGAPKVRAMEIIAELEPSARGAYCGSLGFISPGGDCDFNILIRTITASHGWWQVPVGGGIVSQSQPELEFHETWTKAAGMLKAIASDKGRGGQPQ